MTDIAKKKFEILDAVFKQKDGVSVNELSEMLNELTSISSNKEILPEGFPTNSLDITGKKICLGDQVSYDFDDSTDSFIVVFENNAFRKKYPNWDDTLEKPILEYGKLAINMRLKIVKSNK